MKKIIIILAALTVVYTFLFVAESMATVRVKWAKSYGGTSWDFGTTSIKQTRDSGYIMAGVTYSFGAGRGDLWVLKLDKNGEIQWQKSYGDETGMDDAWSVQQTSDGGYVVAGATQSFGAGGRDIWIVKLNASGEIQWQKTYGGSALDTAWSIQQTSDAGYIVAGTTQSFGAGGRDLWVLKLNGDGDIQWQKTYGVPDSDEWAYLIQQTNDSGYIVSGAYIEDFWILKLDGDGDIQWQKTYGGLTADLVPTFIQQTSDSGGYIVAGTTNSFGGADNDFWVLKLNGDGDIQWQKTYGGSGSEDARSIQPTRDGGYVMTGVTNSSGADDGDFWVLKLNGDGDIQWQKTYGGPRWEAAWAIQQTSDDGYIVGGVTDSFGAGGRDLWVLKLDTEGDISDSCPPDIGQDTSVVPVNTSVVPEDTEATASNSSCTVTSTNVTPQDTHAAIATQCKDINIIKWAKTYGGTNNDDAFSIRQTSDSGYIMREYTNCTPLAEGEFCDFGVLKLDASGYVKWQKTYGKVYLPSGASEILETIDKGYIVAVYKSSFGGDIWVLKLDAGGDIQWQKSYGGTRWDEPLAIQQTTDGSYMLAGFTFSFGTNGDVWILKLQADGDIDWQKAYGGEGWDIADSIHQTADGGYIVAGQANYSFGAVYGDIWVLKLDASGAVQWQKTYGDMNSNSAYFIRQTSDGEYIMLGGTIYSEPPHSDLWILKLDANGNIHWQKTYGGTHYEAAGSIQQTEDGGYIVVGATDSFGAGGRDVWVLKLDGFGVVQWQKTYGGTDHDSASSIQQTLDGGYIVAGTTDSFGAGGRDVWVLKLDAEGNISDSCPSGIGQATSVVPAYTSVVPEDTQASVSDTSCTVTSTSVTPQDTSAAVEILCEN